MISDFHGISGVEIGQQFWMRKHAARGKCIAANGGDFESA